MDVSKVGISDLLLITPKRFGDERGFFSECWNKRTFAEHGVDVEFVQDNHSLSHDVCTVRGLHFQAPPHSQAKLVRCGRGRIYDVAVDIRRGSPTYGEWYGVELSFENGKQLFVPEGFLHGFMTLEPNSEIIYKCSDFYAPESDGAVHWNSCGITWPLATSKATLSEKDGRAPNLADFQSPFNFRGIS